MNRIEEIDDQINSIEAEIYKTKRSPFYFDDRIFNYDNNVKRIINDMIENIKSQYCDALPSLGYFVKLIVEMLNKFKIYLDIKSNIHNAKIMKGKYFIFCHQDFYKIKSKIDTAIEQLNYIKKEQMVANTCLDHVKIFNLLNDIEYTNYSDVIDYVNDSDIDKYAKNKIKREIKKITTDGFVDAEKIDYLINELYFCKLILEHKKDESYNEINLLKRKIEALELKVQKVWKYPKQNENYLYSNSIFNSIDKYVESSDDETLSLIVAFCNQIDYFTVTSVDKISGKIQKFKCYDTNRKTYISYIEKWVSALKNYLYNNIGGDL